MKMRVFNDGKAIVRDALLPQPAGSLKCSIVGSQVKLTASNGIVVLDLPYTEVTDQAGNGFASAALTKAYLDAELAKTPAVTIADVTGLQSALDAKLGTAVTPATPTRAFGTAFRPHATKAVLCIYSVKTQVTNPLISGTSVSTARLLSDAANPPTVERSRAEATSGVGVAVAIAITQSNTATLVYLCPPGHYVLLTSTVTGTGATAIAAQVELVLG